MALMTKYPLDYRPNGDTIDDFARKYMQEMDAIYSVLNAIIGHGVVPDMEIVAGQIKVENGKLYVRNADNTEWKLFGDSEKNLNEVVAVINPDTGTILLRATFNNPNDGLLPGMFVNAQIVQGILPNAFLVPQAALSRTPTGQAMAMLVNAKGQVESRQVTTSGTQGQNWIVTEGLKPGDKIIVDGIANVKPEQKVVAKPYQPKGAAPQSMAPKSAQPEKQADVKPEQKSTSNA